MTSTHTYTHTYHLPLVEGSGLSVGSNSTVIHSHKVLLLTLPEDHLLLPPSGSVELAQFSLLLYVWPSLCLPLFYDHYTGQPALVSTPIKNCMILFEQSFTAACAC